MFFRQVFEPKLAQYAYLIGCQRTGEAIVIDPQRDIDRYLKIAAEEGLRLVAATETHIHADFLSGVRELAKSARVRAYLSDEGGPDWSYAWAADGRDDVRLLKDGDTFSIGNIDLKAVHTPGHTPEHMSFMVTDRGAGADEPMGLASGDFVFVADLGRPDLLESAAGTVGAMEPSARTLYQSVQKFLELPDYLQVWPGHGAGSACGKALGAVPDSTVGYERRFNVSIAAAKDGEDAFVEAILEGQPEPPLYFARMKRDNKTGPAILGPLPEPKKIDAEALERLAGSSDSVVLDTRTNRRDFMASHLRGSIYAPLDKTLPTIAGSYVEAGTQIYLIVQADQVEDAVRDLVRIGLDQIAGYAEPKTLVGLSADALTSTEVVDFERAAALAEQPGALILDVRRRTEFDAGHLRGAQNIAHTRLLARAEEIEPGKRLLVHCLSGARASSASSLLERLGHEVVYIDDHISKASTERAAEVATA